MSIVAVMRVKPSRDSSHNASINITVPPSVGGDCFCESGVNPGSVGGI